VTSNSTYDVLIVGAGIFGAASTLTLAERGHRVAVLDPGPLPHPLAASTDISKVVRIEYANDRDYARLSENARDTWLEWNEWFDEALYHQVGIAMLTRQPMEAGEYEYENLQSLIQRGYQAERLGREAIQKRFPAFAGSDLVDGYYYDGSGYVESGRVVAALLQKAQQAGATVFSSHAVREVLSESGRVQGVRTLEGETFRAGQVVVAAGAWTPYLVTELRPYMHSVGMPVFHLRPDNPELFAAPNFTVFSADVTRTGWYGFPLHPREGVVKIAHHGRGIPVHPTNDERVVTEHETTLLRESLASLIPLLAEAPITYTRRCLYCDTLDENFWIDCHPTINGLVVAAGGSGHAFKFGPLLGGWIADVVEGKDNPDLAKFSWRELSPDTTGQEASRFRQAI
jgi:glycine/D-amino acid oxidase-like deaminating enzyme